MTQSAAHATLKPELQLLAERGARLIAGIDEVGRGALAGPVTIGVVVIDLERLSPDVLSAGVWPLLDGVRDSKLLTPAARVRWQPTICEHAAAHSVQHQSADQIDAKGLTAALGAAGRAGVEAVERSMGRTLDAVLLDGTHDWLTSGADPRVSTMPKADQKSQTVACASVLAKVERDELLRGLAHEHPEFGWESNKGYGSSAHRAAIQVHGPSQHHRRSWNLGAPALPGL
ncbi:ribonuclease HII [Nesterenkonia sp. NBAIMH1]|uniref:ribonuclease HII n=1 Tax=Nesterenkonia sp. NBAIMH1 TaxID=2600320 RepID=UPI0011B7857C|nr:ribonuclease HII [Nesterenkonia sp. NBAIMH1]